MERLPELLIQPLSPAEIAIQQMFDEGCPHPPEDVTRPNLSLKPSQILKAIKANRLTALLQESG